MMEDICQFKVLRETDKFEFNKILDVGCGNGYATNYFIEKDKDVTALTLSPETYNLPTGNVKVVVGNVEKLPFEDNSFDAVWCYNLLEHTHNNGIALKEMRRVLKDGGFLFIGVPEYEPYIHGGHVSPNWNVGQLMYVLAVNGFNIKRGKFVNISR